MSGGFKYVETNRVSKAQKRRDAKAAKKAEQIKRIDEAEKQDEHRDRRIEQEALEAQLVSKNLEVYDIEADGDCLFRAVEHQLSLANDTDEMFTHKELRLKTGQYMLDHSGNFMPFLTNRNGDLMNRQEFEEYCNKIATTREWGGHLELTAISRITKKPIHIYQAISKKPLVIEPDLMPAGGPSKSPILLSFHQHLYHLGEHYNSLVMSATPRE